LQAAAPAALTLPWLGLTVLLLVARGDPEALLRRAFVGRARTDAFEHLNGVSTSFWIAHTCLAAVGIAAARSRRAHVLQVLLIGPLMAAAICLIGQDWSDPNWFVVVAVCTIGWLVSTAVAAAYWVSRPAVAPNSVGEREPPDGDSQEITTPPP